MQTFGGDWNRAKKRKREKETRWDKERKIWERIWEILWNEFWIVLKEYSGLNNGFSIFSPLSNALLLSLAPSLSRSLLSILLVRFCDGSKISFHNFNWFHFTTFCTQFQCFRFFLSSSTLTLELKFSIVILPPYSEKISRIFFLLGRTNHLIWCDFYVQL